MKKKHNFEKNMILIADSKKVKSHFQAQTKKEKKGSSVSR
jgi:hypothetical protein